MAKVGTKALHTHKYHRNVIVQANSKFTVFQDIYISDVLKDINIRIVINNTNAKCITFYPALWS